MRDILIVFIVLLVLLIVISTLGGSVKPSEKFQAKPSFNARSIAETARQSYQPQPFVDMVPANVASLSSSTASNQNNPPLFPDLISEPEKEGFLVTGFEPSDNLAPIATQP